MHNSGRLRVDQSCYYTNGMAGFKAKKRPFNASNKRPKREEIVWILEDEDSNDRESENEIGKTEDSDILYSFSLTRTGKKELRYSVDDLTSKSKYFRMIIESLKSYSVLDHLKTSPAVGYIIQDLVPYISDGLKKPENEELAFLKAIHCLLSNRYISPDIYIDAFTNALVTFLIEYPAVGSNHYLLKDIAADILSQMFYKYSTPRLWNCIVSELSKAFDSHHQEPLDEHQGLSSRVHSSTEANIHYGAVVASLSMGVKATAEVIPRLSEYYNDVFAATVTPSRRGMLKIWDKLLTYYFTDCRTSTLTVEDRYNRFRDEKALCFPVGLVKCRRKKLEKSTFMDVLLNKIVEAPKIQPEKKKEKALLLHTPKKFCFIPEPSASTDSPSEKGDLEEFKSTTEVESRLQSDDEDNSDIWLYTSEEANLEFPEISPELIDISGENSNLEEFNSAKVESKLQNDGEDSVDKEQALSLHTSDEEIVETLMEELLKQVI